MKIHSIKFNFIMNALLTVSAIIFPLITFPYISRVLLVDGSGKVAFAISVVSYFTMFASLGVPTYGIRACAKVRDDREKLSATVQELLIINGITTAVIYVAFFLSLAVIPKFNEQRILLTVVSFSIVLNTMGIQWLYSALEQYSYITFCALGFKVVGLVLMFAFVHSPEDYIIYGAVSAFASYGSGILNFINMRKFVSLKKTVSYDFKRHIRPILTFFFMSAAASIYLNLDMVMLGFMKTDTDVGYYNAAIKVKTVLVNVVTSLGTVLLPRLSFYIEKGEMEAFRKTVVKAVRFVVTAGSALMVFFIIFARESILILSKEPFLPATFPMQLLMLTVLLIGLSNITGIQILTPMGREDKVLISVVAGAVVDFVLNLFLIPHFASAGAAFATVMAELVVLIIQCVYLKDMLKGLLTDVRVGKVAFALAAASILSVLLKTSADLGPFVTMLIAAFLFFGSYGGLLLAMKDPLVTEIADMGVRAVLKRK